MLSLNRLIRVGVGAQVDWRALVATPGQLLLKNIGGIGLGNQAGFEIEPGGEVPVGMTGPRITVDAAVLDYTYR